MRARTSHGLAAMAVVAAVSLSMAVMTSCSGSDSAGHRGATGGVRPPGRTDPRRRSTPDRRERSMVPGSSARIARPVMEQRAKATSDRRWSASRIGWASPSNSMSSTPARDACLRSRPHSTTRKSPRSSSTRDHFVESCDCRSLNGRSGSLSPRRPLVWFARRMTFDGSMGHGRSRRRARAVVVGSVLALAAGACSSGSGTTGGASSSKAPAAANGSTADSGSEPGWRTYRHDLSNTGVAAT